MVLKLGFGRPAALTTAPPSSGKVPVTDRNRVAVGPTAEQVRVERLSIVSDLW